MSKIEILQSLHNIVFEFFRSSNLFKHDEVRNMSNLFQTISKFVPEPIDIEVSGLPEWIDGIFYRNGPLKYEYGDHTEPEFKHFFDPTGGLQAIRVKDGKLTYRLVKFRLI